MCVRISADLRSKEEEQIQVRNHENSKTKETEKKGEEEEKKKSGEEVSFTRLSHHQRMKNMSDDLNNRQNCTSSTGGQSSEMKELSFYSDNLKRREGRAGRSKQQRGRR